MGITDELTRDLAIEDVGDDEFVVDDVIKNNVNVIADNIDNGINNNIIDNTIDMEISKTNEMNSQQEKVNALNDLAKKRRLVLQMFDNNDENEENENNDLLF